MVALICNRFGIEQIDAAEDMVSETFLAAAETWGLERCSGQSGGLALSGGKEQYVEWAEA